jgi:hypothetical protein
MTGKSDETVDAGTRRNSNSNTTATATATPKLNSTKAMTTFPFNNKSSSRKVKIPKRSLLDEDDDDDDEEDNHEVETLYTKAAAPPKEPLQPNTAAPENWDPLQSRTHGRTRRHTLSTTTPATAPPAEDSSTNSNNNTNNTSALPHKHYAWDDFVRQGTRVKTFLDDAMQHVKTSTKKLKFVHVSNNNSSTKRGRDLSSRDDPAVNDDDHDDYDNDNDSPRPLRRRRLEENDHTAELAREKTEQVMLLQRVSATKALAILFILSFLFVSSHQHTRLVFLPTFQKLKEAESHTAALQASTDSLREEAANSQNRLERTVAALRIAGSNAAKARADADTAEATAQGLSTSLHSLSTVVTETKRACALLQQEQHQVSVQANSVTTKLLHKEADLSRAHKELTGMRQQLHELLDGAAKWQQDRRALVELSETRQQELTRLEHQHEERDAMQQARKERAGQVEHEWRQVQAMLVEATGGQAVAEQTQALLKETILELQAANKNLHDQLWQQQESSRKEKDRLYDALTKAEKEAQQLRIQEEASEEDSQRLRLDKNAAEKQVAQLKGRIVGFERRLKDAAVSGTMVSPDALNNNNFNIGAPNDASASSSNGNGLGFSLPPLSGSSRLSLASGQDNSNNNIGVAAPKPCCSICFKAAFGLMKSCQCGKSCDKRAHLTCASRINPGPSVSHPGTPAPRLPLILCSASMSVAATGKSN